MAQKIVKTLIDDLDGTEAHTTIRFSLDGVDYEIDLSTQNEDRLRNELEDFIAAARRAGGAPRGIGRRGPNKKKAARHTKQELLAIRRWAAENKLKLSDRGRIPQEILDAYEEAHSG